MFLWALYEACEDIAWVQGGRETAFRLFTSHAITGDLLPAVTDY